MGCPSFGPGSRLHRPLLALPFRPGSRGRAWAPAALPTPAALGYLDVRVVDTDYRSFAVLYLCEGLEGAPSTTVQLYSEARPASPVPWARPFGTCPRPPLGAYWVPNLLNALV